tara:strand:- start:91 stop:351 length:261 start_codon:yes stop_codon:yes gene_type:complete
VVKGKRRKREEMVGEDIKRRMSKERVIMQRKTENDTAKGRWGVERTEEGTNRNRRAERIGTMRDEVYEERRGTVRDESRGTRGEER